MVISRPLNFDTEIADDFSDENNRGC